jgi:hypothetical protein
LEVIVAAYYITFHPLIMQTTVLPKYYYYLLPILKLKKSLT